VDVAVSQAEVLCSVRRNSRDPGPLPRPQKKKKKSEIPAFSFQGCPPTGQSSEEELASVDGSP
jgi:hypothetical protein